MIKMDEFMRRVCGLSHIPQYQITDNGLLFDIARHGTAVTPTKKNITQINESQNDVHNYAIYREFLKRDKKESRGEDEMYSFELMFHEIDPHIKGACRRIAHQNSKESWWCVFGIHQHKPIPESDVMLVCQCGHAKIDYKRC